MKRFIVPMVMFLASCQYLNEEKAECTEDFNANYRIQIINQAKTPLLCSRVDYVDNKWKYSKGFQVGPSSSKYLKMCSYDARYACSLITKHENTTYSTFLTPYIAGDYKVTLEDVPWKNPGPQKTRQATVIELPNGEKSSGCNCDE